uniref:Uncharacterized protein n=1 Tax=Globisporangium ultimum (strain ATCC 200006 / CBS 805.95 / DAOM BR144) TaxID=431595 RepID=K3WLN0_GLOUD
MDVDCKSCHPADAEAIKRTLLNPAELIFPGRLVQEGAVDALIVCCAVKGAILCERPGTTLTSPVLIFRIKVEAEFEALCEKDRWVCVVVPGFGLDWNAGRYELMLRTYSERKPSRPGDRVFLECVGAQLSGLDLSEFGELRDETNDVLHAIVTHYVHLKHLALKGCRSMDEKEVAPLLAALRGNLGPKLDSLNLNDSFTTHETLDQLACIL